MTKKEILESFIKFEIVKFNFIKPYPWASGLQSPVYLDLKKIGSYPDLYKSIHYSISVKILDFFQDEKLIPDNDGMNYMLLGIETGSIALAATLAFSGDKPFGFIRKKPKEHGKKDLIEANIKDGDNIVIVEDVFSTGESSIQAYDILKKHLDEKQINAKILGIIAVYSHNLPDIKKNLELHQLKVPMKSLFDFSSLIQTAQEVDTITHEQFQLLEQFQADPWSFSESYWKTVS